MFKVNNNPAYRNAYAVYCRSDWGAKMIRDKAAIKKQVKVLATVEKHSNRYPVDLAAIVARAQGLKLDGEPIWMVNLSRECVFLSPVDQNAGIEDLPKLLGLPKISGKEARLIDLFAARDRIKNFSITEIRYRYRSPIADEEKKESVAATRLSVWQILQILSLVEGIQPLEVGLKFLINANHVDYWNGVGLHWELTGDIFAREGGRSTSRTNIHLCGNLEYIQPPFTLEQLQEIKIARKAEQFPAVFELDKQALASL